MILRARTLVALGSVWSVGLMTLQGLEIPSADSGIVDWSAIAWALPGWTIVGIAMAFAVERGAAWLERPARALIAVVVASLVLSALWTAIYAFTSTWYAHSEWAAARIADPAGAFAYQTWMVAFYGGSYLLAWNLHRRTMRSREMLVRLEIAQMSRRAREGQLELERLRSRVDPALLLRAIAEARYRMQHAGDSAERLLVKLSTFLRAAMPAAGADETGENANRHLVLLLEDLEGSHDTR